MGTAYDLRSKLGTRRIADRVGVGVNAVYNWRERFPASYYPGIRDLCDEDGIECPMHLFNWRQAKAGGAA